MIDKDLYYIFALVTFLFAIGTYALIRAIISSIVFCEMGKKAKRIKSEKNITMSYLSDYIIKYKKPYDFWMKIRRIYVVVELLILAVYLLFPLTGCDLLLPFALNTAQAFIWFIVISVQFDFNRNTKYDRVRQAKHK